MKKVFITIICLLALILCVGCNSEKEELTTATENLTTEAQTNAETTAVESAESNETTKDAETTTEEFTTVEEVTTVMENVIIERTIDQRYFIYRVWNFFKNSQSDFEKTVDAAEAAGFNAIKVHIPWTWVEETEGVYKYGDFDKMIDYVVNKKGMSVAISLDMTRIQGDGIIPDSEIMVSRKGELCVGGVGGNRTQISFASQHAVDKAVAFYQNAVEHYESTFGDTGKILFYLPAFSQYCETEYWCLNEYDYSEQAVNAFHKYLQETYGTVDSMNTALSTKYASFDEVEAPATSNTKKIGEAWYQFRHSLLKNAIDKLADAQKSVAPNSKIAVQFGCVYDDAARSRCTLGFVDLCEKVDVLWCDDGPTMDHLFSMSYVWNALPANVEFAQEIDGPSQVGASPENYLKQGNECFACGCKYVSIANWAINETFNQYKPVWRELSDTWLTRTVPEVMNSYSVLYPDQDPYELTISITKVFKNGYSSQKKGFDKQIGNGKPVVIYMKNDFINQ